MSLDAVPPKRQVSEQPVAFTEPEDEWGDMPPPPDNFPQDWENEWQPSFDEARMAAHPEPRPALKPVGDAVPLTPDTVEVDRLPERQGDPSPVHGSVLVQKIETTQSPANDFLPSLYIPLAQEDSDKDHPPQQITVTLRSTGDKERDRRRIKTLYGTLISFHGKDRFSFHIFENGKGHLIDFPNDTTRVCPEVLDRLRKLIGEESWRVEEITFQ